MDFYTALVHINMDNEQNLGVGFLSAYVTDFVAHHSNPRSIMGNLGEQLAQIHVLTLPSIFIPCVWFIANADFCVGALFLNFWGHLAQISHRHSHSSPKETCLGLRLLEQAHVIMPPAYHRKHHLQQNCNYATLSGNAEFLLVLLMRMTTSRLFYLALLLLITVAMTPINASLTRAVLSINL